ncbi:MULTISPECIES: LicD family protein [Bacteroidota]|uniref:LicD family protein n=1 Tax=Bacteroidota TaxID=976 RepID=UPI0008A3C615|nr:MULTISPECIES: LicD family protein [Bacteroidota]OFV17717.1 hypothetical protein HMPREF3127_08415 [Sphingobacterium sp. HMSC13C05]
MKKIVITLPENVDCQKFQHDNSYEDITSQILKDFNIDKSYHLEQYGFALSPSEIATFLLHISAWTRFLASDENHCLIIEENVNSNYLNFEPDFFDLLPDGWDVYFPYSGDGIKQNQTKLLNPNSREYYDVEPFFFGYEWGSSIYFLSKKGVEKLLLNINTIRQRVEDEIFKIAKLNTIDVYFSNYNETIKDYIKPKIHLDRNAIIKEAVLNYNVWTEKDFVILNKLLTKISSAAEKLDIKLILQGGTHLGYVRHGGIMKWDDDVDLGVLASEFENLKNELLINGCQLVQHIEEKTNTPFYKAFLKEGKVIDGYDFKFPCIDLWLYNIKGCDIIFENGIICKDSALHDPKKIIFEGNNLFILHNSLDVLDTRYNDWRTKIRIYSFSHETESERFHAISTKIKVDKEGRII